MAKPSFLDHVRPRRALAMAACCLAPLWSGCRAVDNAQVDVMERELRQQEQYIYELEDYLMEYSEKLRECRTCQTPMVVETKAASRRPARKQPTLADDSAIDLDAPPRRPSGGAQTAPPASSAPSTAAPAIESESAADLFEEGPASPPPSTPATAPESPPAGTPLNPENFAPPELEIDPTSELDWKRSAPVAARPEKGAAAPTGDEAPPFIPDPAHYEAEVALAPADGQELTLGPATDEPGVIPELAISELAVPPATAAEPELPPPADAARLTAERLQIRAVLSQPSEVVDGGVSSLLVIVEALNATDEPVDANGTVSLMVTRGETKETLRPVDRWDFTPEETEAAWQSSQLGDGLHLELPLRDVGLPQEPIFLWVRLVTPEGRNLRTHVPFTVADLTTLDEALAALEAAAAEVASSGGEALAPTEGEAELASIAVPAPPPTPPTRWRASTQPVAADPEHGFATAAGGSSLSGWKRQPAGRSAPSVRRPAGATSGPPAWQQGSAEPPASDSGGAWAPSR
jgi:hypothetical protein